MRSLAKGTIDARKACCGIFAAFFVFIGQSAFSADVRKAARISAEWAIQSGNAHALSDSIGLLLDSGSTLAADDPFSVSHLLAELQELEGSSELVAALKARTPRGQLGGSPRVDFELGAGESRKIEMTMVAREAALVEARLFRGSEGADIDIDVTGPNNTTVAQDTGPSTGIQEFGAFVEFWPSSCLVVTVTVSNVGNEKGKVAVLAPLTFESSCEG